MAMKRIGVAMLVFGILGGAVSFAFSSIDSSINADVEWATRVELEQKRIVLDQIQKLQKASPEQDFARAWARGDHRFIGNYGQMYFLPGVAKNQANTILRQKNVNFIKGTGNGTDTPEEKKLHNLAAIYAKRYNALLLKSLKGIK